MPSHRRSVAALALALVGLAACRSKPQPVPAPAPPPPAPAPTPAAPAPRVNQDSIDRARAAEAARLAATAAAAAAVRARTTLGDPIYFDYDKDDIRDDQRATLEAKVPILNANPNVRIRIAGHCDERGSDAYNIALGQRRAAAAKRYLVSRGIAESRMEVVSFGEERPAMQGESEDAWARNRRDEFEIIAGGENLRAPQ